MTTVGLSAEDDPGTTAGTTVSDVVFARRDATDLRLDIYLPPGAGAGRDAPALVWLHGGGWLVGSKTDGAANRFERLAGLGIAVVSIEYRLSTQATFPAQLDDVRDAVRWVRQHGSEQGLATDRLAIGGCSAGAHLSILAGLAEPRPDDAELGVSAVDAVVAWYPPTDLSLVGTDTPDGPLPTWLRGPLPVPSFEARLLGVERVADAPLLARSASPVHQVRAGAPPFLLLHGDHDGLIPLAHSRELHRRLTAHGVESTLLVLADANHDDVAFDSPAVLGAVAGFVSDVIGHHPG